MLSLLDARNPPFFALPMVFFLQFYTVGKCFIPSSKDLAPKAGLIVEYALEPGQQAYS